MPSFDISPRDKWERQAYKMCIRDRVRYRMKILANKEIENLFLSHSLVFGVSFLLAEVFLWLSYRRLSLLLLILFLLAGGAVWAVCFVYFLSLIHI